jgi:hypothetical protein
MTLLGRALGVLFCFGSSFGQAPALRRIQHVSTRIGGSKQGWRISGGSGGVVVDPYVSLDGFGRRILDSGRAFGWAATLPERGGARPGFLTYMIVSGRQFAPNSNEDDKIVEGKNKKGKDWL